MAPGGDHLKIPRDAVTPQQWRALEERVVVVHRDDEACFRFTGPGRVACLQGLVTCDLDKATVGSHHFGALLTSKGMVVSPLRMTLLDDQMLMTLPKAAALQVGPVLTKSLPPRLCTFEDVTDQAAILGWYGPRAGEALPLKVQTLGPGQSLVERHDEQMLVVAHSMVRGAPGYDVVVLPGGSGGGAPSGPSHAPVRGESVLAACRIFAGIPALGAEIDDKTLPQEVRYEALGAISYTKGCYLGQETVARVHFRGHPNRRLVLLVLDGEPDEPPIEVRDGDKVVGRLTSTAWSPDLDAWVAQAMLRREIEDGANVTAGDVSAVVRVDRWLRDP